MEQQQRQFDVGKSSLMLLLLPLHSLKEKCFLLSLKKILWPWSVCSVGEISSLRFLDIPSLHFE